MVRVDSVVVWCLLLAAAPAAAQNTDVFREGAPPPPTVLPAPRPAPRPRPAPEPEIVAPAPSQPAVAASVPTLPSASQIWARVRQVANSESIAVPLAGTPAFDQGGTPPQYRALLGAWGPGMWQGDSIGEKLILVVQSVDSDDNVRGVIGSNSATIGWRNFTAPIANGRFTIHFQLTYSGSFGGAVRGLGDVYWEIAAGSDDTLRGSRNNNASTVVLSRLR